MGDDVEFQVIPVEHVSQTVLVSRFNCWIYLIAMQYLGAWKRSAELV